MSYREGLIFSLVRRNWLLGYRIASEEMQGEDRARYGSEIIKKLAKELSAEYGKEAIEQTWGGGPYFTAKYFFPVLLPYAPNTKAGAGGKRNEKEQRE